MRYFYQKLYGTDTINDIALSEKETSFAASLLEKHNAEEIRSFVDYGLSEAIRTNFDIKTFGGLKKYYAPYMKKLSREVQTTSRETNEKKQRDELHAYDSYLQGEIMKLRRALPPDDLERRDLEAAHPGAKIFSGWVRKRADRLLGEKHSLPSFNEWLERGG